MEAFEKLGTAQDLEKCRELLWDVERGRKLPVPLVNPASIVSSCKRCYSLGVLILRSKPREPNDRIDSCVEFFKCISQITKDPLTPPSFKFALSAFFLPENFLSFINLHSHTSFNTPTARRSHDGLPLALYVSLSLLLYFVRNWNIERFDHTSSVTEGL